MLLAFTNESFLLYAGDNVAGTSADGGPGGAKKAKAESSATKTNIDSDDDDESYEEEATMDFINSPPIIIPVRWEDHLARRRITLNVATPAGSVVKSTDMIVLKVTADGWGFQFSYPLPKAIHSWNIIEKNYSDAQKNDPDYLIRMVEHKKYFRKLLNGVTKIMSSPIIRLPFQVSNEFTWDCISCAEGARNLAIHLVEANPKMYEVLETKSFIDFK